MCFYNHIHKYLLVIEIGTWAKVFLLRMASIKTDKSHFSLVLNLEDN